MVETRPPSRSRCSLGDTASAGSGSQPEPSVRELSWVPVARFPTLPVPSITIGGKWAAVCTSAPEPLTVVPPPLPANASTGPLAAVPLPEVPVAPPGAVVALPGAVVVLPEAVAAPAEAVVLLPGVVDEPEVADPLASVEAAREVDPDGKGATPVEASPTSADDGVTAVAVAPEVSAAVPRSPALPVPLPSGAVPVVLPPPLLLLPLVVPLVVPPLVPPLVPLPAPPALATDAPPPPALLAPPPASVALLPPPAGEVAPELADVGVFVSPPDTAFVVVPPPESPSRDAAATAAGVRLPSPSGGRYKLIGASTGP